MIIPGGGKDLKPSYFFENDDNKRIIDTYPDFLMLHTAHFKLSDEWKAYIEQKAIEAVSILYRRIE